MIREKCRYLLGLAAAQTPGWERPDRLRDWFFEVTLAGTVDQRVEVDNDENAGSIWVCRSLRRPWAEIWDAEVRHCG